MVHKDEGRRREDIRIKYIRRHISCTSRAFFLGGRARVSICASCGETESSWAIRSQRCWSQPLARVEMSREGHLIHFDCECISSDMYSHTSFFRLFWGFWKTGRFHSGSSIVWIRVNFGKGRVLQDPGRCGEKLGRGEDCPSDVVWRAELPTWDCCPPPLPPPRASDR